MSASFELLMKEGALENGLITARTLLDEASRLCKYGDPNDCFRDLLGMAASVLSRYGLEPSFNPHTLEYVIVSPHEVH